MKKVVEYTNVTYYYDNREERDEHVKQMESDGWECSGQIKETFSLTKENDWTYVGKFTKFNN